MAIDCLATSFQFGLTSAPIVPHGRHMRLLGSVRLGGDLLDQRDNGTAHLRITNTRECPDQGDAVRCSEEVAHVGGHLCGRLARFRKSGRPRCSLEEKRHGHIEKTAQLLEAARADAVCARLVFSNLLERQTERVADFGLALVQHDPTHTEPAADVLVYGNWKTITFIAALRHDRITAPFVLEGPMTGEMFKAYTEQLLAPTLKRGDIVFMDNVSVHKVDGIEEASLAANRGLRTSAPK
jgi:DDE superfamily endonuclease